MTALQGLRQGCQIQLAQTLKHNIDSSTRAMFWNSLLNWFIGPCETVRAICYHACLPYILIGASVACVGSGNVGSLRNMHKGGL